MRQSRLPFLIELTGADGHFKGSGTRICLTHQSIIAVREIPRTDEAWYETKGPDWKVPKACVITVDQTPWFVMESYDEILTALGANFDTDTEALSVVGANFDA